MYLTQLDERRNNIAKREAVRLATGNADENDNLGLDLAVQRDGNGVGTGNLDGLILLFSALQVP